MEEDKLISKGYFPKELLPAYHTEKLEENLSRVKAEWQGIPPSSSQLPKTSFPVTS